MFHIRPEKSHCHLIWCYHTKLQPLECIKVKTCPLMAAKCDYRKYLEISLFLLIWLLFVVVCHTNVIVLLHYITDRYNSQLFLLKALSTINKLDESVTRMCPWHYHGKTVKARNLILIGRAAPKHREMLRSDPIHSLHNQCANPSIIVRLHDQGASML